MPASKNQFPLYQHNGIYYVRFKNLQTGKFLSGKSAGKSSEKDALAEAWKMYADALTGGAVNARKAKRNSIETRAFKSIVRRAEFTNDEMMIFLDEAKRRGILRVFTLAGSASDVPAYKFMRDFWTWGKSEYIAEKLRQNHSIGKPYCKAQFFNIETYLKPFLGGKVLGEITKQDIFDFVKIHSKLDLCFQTRNVIIRSGITALKWAYEHELVEKDFSKGIIY